MTASQSGTRPNGEWRTARDGQRRGVLATLLLLVLAGAVRAGEGGAAVPTSPPPVVAEKKLLIAPDKMLPVDQIRPGMKGVGRSVFEGTKIEEFHVTVLGVLRKIDFGGDMVLIRIDDGPPVTSGAGVSQGMSGSPIYVDGKLIGALAFAWPFAKQPVAGVTPISQMLENYQPGSTPKPPGMNAADSALAAPSGMSGDLRVQGEPLRLDGKLFSQAMVVPDRALAVGGSRPGTLYLTPVGTPVMVSGMGRIGIEALQRRFRNLPVAFMQGPGKTELPPDQRPKIEPGAAIGVQLLGGDIDATGIGTVTYVDGEHVVAFGHPMFGLGTIDLPMTTAFIHGIIPSQEVSFKMGSPVETVGTVSQDRNWSIGGRVGPTSRMIPADLQIRDLDRGVRAQYRVTAAVQRDLTPNLLFSAVLSAVGSVSPPATGTTRGIFEIFPRGLPPIRRENVFAIGERRTAFEQLFLDPSASLPLAELLQLMDLLDNNKFGVVPVERLNVSVEVSQKRRTATIERAYADRKRVKPGDTVKVGVVIQPVDGPREVRELEVRVPRNIPGGRLLVGVAGGASAERVRQTMQVTRPPSRSLAQLVNQIADREQNSELTIEVAQPVVGIAVSGREFPNLPNIVVEVLTGANPSGVRMVRSHNRQRVQTDWVLSGSQVLTLQVEADEKDKSGPLLLGGLGGLPAFGSILDLFRLGLGGDGGGLLGDVEGDEGEDGTGELDGVATRRLRDAGRTALAPGDGAPPRKDLPLDAPLPTFEELQQLLEGGGSGEGSSSGGATTPTRKGLARTPGVWRHGSARDFQAGRQEGVLISSRGEVALAPLASPLLVSPDRSFWAQAADRDGNVYVGGWLDGRVLKLDPGGKPHEFFTAPDELAISALTGDAAGDLYAAAEPSGTIYRIRPDGKGTPFCRLEDRRIWCLRRIGEFLYAGTGSEGELHRIGRDGKAELVFTAADRHILALAEDGKGGLYVGTYPRGKVYHHHDGKTEPIFELPNTTVTALASDGKGNVYIGTSPRAAVLRLTPAGDVQVLFQGREKHVFSLVTDEAGYLYAAVGSPARVYRIAPDRTTATLWDPQAAYVLSLSRDGTGNLYATTAGPTRIVRLSAAPAPAGTYTSTVLNAGNLSRWGAVRWSGATEGIHVQTRTGNTSFPDATWSDWSRPCVKPVGEPITSPPGQYLQYRVVLAGKAGVPHPTLRGIELFYRARNRSPEVKLKGPNAGDTLSGTRPIRWEGKDPDSDKLGYEVFQQKENTDVWVRIGSRKPGQSDDEAADAGPMEARGSLRGARGREWRLANGARRTSPYRPAPRLRVVGAFRGNSPGAGRDTRHRSLVAGAAAPHPGQTPRAVQSGAGGNSRQRGAVSAPPGGAPGENPLLGIEADPETSLEELTGGGTSLNWNTKKVPDGRYRLKVVATDAATSPDDATTGETISEFVRVDNTPPQVLLGEVKRVGAGPPLLIPAMDAGAYVGSAEYRVGAGEWVAAAAEDGIFDSDREVVKINPTLLPNGRQVLEIRVRDAAGNEASVRIPYIQGPIGRPGGGNMPGAAPVPGVGPAPGGGRVPEGAPEGRKPHRTRRKSEGARSRPRKSGAR